jgi:hypothetical protein
VGKSFDPAPQLRQCSSALCRIVGGLHELELELERRYRCPELMSRIGNKVLLSGDLSLEATQ